MAYCAPSWRSFDQLAFFDQLAAIQCRRSGATNQRRIMGRRGRARTLYPALCPRGRPSVVRLSQAEILFHRSGGFIHHFAPPQPAHAKSEIASHRIAILVVIPGRRMRRAPNP